MKLYIGNLSYDVSEADLAELFATVGEVSVNLITDRDTGRSKGFAFAEFESKDNGESAISEYDGHDFKGRPMRVSEIMAVVLRYR